MNRNAAALFEQHQRAIWVHTDRVFIVLMTLQWVGGILAAWLISPHTWIGARRLVHPHIVAAVLLGGLIASGPIILALLRPGAALTRHVIAVAQMMFSAVLIHLSGGRIETHFHVFGSLAFLSFYRDIRVLGAATFVVAIDHLLRGLYWPESVFGVLTASSWRWAEHAGWVVFEDVFLVISCRRGLRELREIAVRHTRLETMHQEVERRVGERTSELLRSKEQLLEAKEAAEAANEAKGRFLATMSHELRTPMNGVLGMSSLLLTEPLGHEHRELVSTIHGSATKLLEVLNDILDFSKVDAGRLELDAAPFSLEDVVDGVVELLGHLTRAKGIGLERVLAPEVPLALVGDALRLRQVLVNLVGNAVKFTERGGVTLAIRAVRVDEGAARLRFEVRDTGVGIAADHQTLLFCPFQQIDGSASRRFGGTGLGLAICRQLVGLMGGEIELESAPGRGSSFSFEIELPRAPEAARAPRQVGGAARPARASEPRSGRILVVEDNEVNQKVVVRMLRRFGLEPDVVPSGLDALERLHAAAYDLVLMDCQMPGLDGYETTARIRALPGDTARTPIVAMTANALKGDRERCLEAGMDDYVSKPVRPQILGEVLQQWLGARETPRPEGRRPRAHASERSVRPPAGGAPDPAR